MSIPQQVKVMYFGPLPGGRSHTAFRSRWRQHGRLAMGLPMWRHMARYEQHDVLTAGEEQLSAAQLEGSRTDAYGGVGMIWFRDADALASASADPDVAVMCTDEIATFGRELGVSLVPTTEHVVYDRGAGSITLIAVIWRQPSVTREEFSEQWLAMGELFAAAPELAGHVCRYVQNHALVGADGADGFVELGFQSAEELAAFMAEPRLTTWLTPIESEFVDYARIEIVVARRTVLYEETDDATRAEPHPGEARTRLDPSSTR